MSDVPVVVIGGGVVGVAVAWALAQRDVRSVVLEARDGLGQAASGTNSGILHTGFDSVPGELETRLILRSAELRDPVLERLGVPVVRCGAELVPHDDEERATVVDLARNAERNGVEASVRADGALDVPGEAITDAVAYTRALAEDSGAEVRTRSRVEAIEEDSGGLLLRVAGAGAVRCGVAVNCAGLYADDVARLVGDDSFAVYPRKGEFFLFDAPDGERLERILLPVPTKRTKGVLVFPRLDGRVAAGPTAVDLDDKEDWSVRSEARDEVVTKAAALLPWLARAEPVGAWAGLRPAGRGVNYVIGPSRACPRLINVAAIRSTGLSASLGIGEHVAGLVAT